MKKVANSGNLIDKKILFWTWTSPYSPSGSPDILRNLISFFASDNVFYAFGKLEKNPIDLHFSFWQRDLSFLDNFRFFNNKRLGSGFTLGVKLPILVILGIFYILKHRPDFIFTVYYNEEWILSAYLVSLFTRTPIYYYCHDPFKEKFAFASNNKQRMAAFIERITLKSANVIVLYDSLKELYQTSYDIQVKVLPHIARFERRPFTKLKRSKICIGFAGSIYENNQDLIEQLLSVTRNRSDIAVKFWGSYSEDILNCIGANNDQNLSVEFEKDYSALIGKLSVCDLLYLPLSFIESSAMPRDCLKYVLPTKAIDYLLAGPPILVHCPSDFETSRFFDSHKAAYILNSKEKLDLEQFLNSFFLEELNPIEEKDIHKAASRFDRVKSFSTFKEILS